MRVTLKDIAKEAGVSKSTVSMYLNNHPLSANMADATKARIKDVVDKLGYKPSYTARALSNKRTQTIGLVIADFANASIIDDIVDQTEKYGYRLLLGVTRYDPEKEIACLEDLLQRDTDGILYQPLYHYPKTITSRLCDAHFPLLLMNQSSTQFSCTAVDLEGAFDDAIAHLKQKHGAKVKIGLLCPDTSNCVNMFSKLCSKRKVKSNVYHTDFTLQSNNFDQLCRQFLSDKLDGILIFNWTMTSLVVEAMQAVSGHQPDIISMYAPKVPPPAKVSGIILIPTLVTEAVSKLVSLIETPEAQRQAEQITGLARFMAVESDTYKAAEECFSNKYASQLKLNAQLKKVTNTGLD